MHESPAVPMKAPLIFLIGLVTIWPAQLQAQGEASVIARPPSRQGTMNSGQLPWLAGRCGAAGLELLIGPVPDGVEGALSLDLRVAMQNPEAREMSQWRAGPSGNWRVGEASVKYSSAPKQWLVSPPEVGAFVQEFRRGWRKDPELVLLGMQGTLFHWIVVESDRFAGPPELGQFAVQSGRGLGCADPGGAEGPTQAGADEQEAPLRS